MDAMDGLGSFYLRGERGLGRRDVLFEEARFVGKEGGDGGDEERWRTGRVVSRVSCSAL
jgi:hypothetical protein